MENQTGLQIITQPAMQALAIKDVAGQIQAVEECIKTLMKVDLHYGKIPGCGDKPTLLKPGAEMLARLFNLRPEFKRERRDLGNGHMEIMSSCTMYSRTSGMAVGEGAGTCSTMESKYRWRKSQRACPKCGVEGSISRSKFTPKENPSSQPGWYCRDCKAQFGYDDPEIRNQQAGRVENPDIADQYNTVNKIADKRAYVAAVITSVGASDFVTQDIEDFYDGQQPTEPTKQHVAPNAQKQPTIQVQQSNRVNVTTQAQSPARMSGIDAGEKIKEKLESDVKYLEWSVFKGEIQKKYPDGKLTDILSDHFDEIMADIEAGKYSLPF